MENIKKIFFIHILCLLCIFSMASDAVMLEDFKNENVKSCIIYEMCIKEKCNSIINKYLSSFGNGCQFIIIIACKFI